jgi:DNA-binding MarR family transcriptional regulator
MPKAKLTEKQIFCLEFLAKQDGTSVAIAFAAVDAGLNRTAYGSPDWADAPMRGLREAGLVEHTGEKENAAKIHRITGEGRKALEAARAEA